MRAAAICIASGLYVPDCRCDVWVAIERGDTAPRCPVCRAAVDWSFVRSTHLTGTPPPRRPLTAKHALPPAPPAAAGG
jgi:hypothetical protein